MKSRVAAPDVDGVKDDILVLKRDLAALIDKMITAADAWQYGTNFCPAARRRGAHAP